MRILLLTIFYDLKKQQRCRRSLHANGLGRLGAPRLRRDSIQGWQQKHTVHRVQLWPNWKLGGQRSIQTKVEQRVLPTAFPPQNDLPMSRRL